MNSLSANFVRNLAIIPLMKSPQMTSFHSWTVSPKVTKNSPEKTAIRSCPHFSISSATISMKGSQTPATFLWWKRCFGQNAQYIGTSSKKRRWMKSYWKVPRNKLQGIFPVMKTVNLILLTNPAVNSGNVLAELVQDHETQESADTGADGQGRSPDWWGAKTHKKGRPGRPETDPPEPKKRKRPGIRIHPAKGCRPA